MILTRPTLIQLYFSAEGRLGRVGFWLLATTLVAALASFEQVAFGPARAVVAAPLKFALFVSGACVLAKRLHDRGRAGWWSAAVLFAFLIAWPGPRGWPGAIACLTVLAAAVELGLVRGERHFNRFGPPPS